MSSEIGVSNKVAYDCSIATIYIHIMTSKFCMVLLNMQFSHQIRFDIFNTCYVSYDLWQVCLYEAIRKTLKVGSCQFFGHQRKTEHVFLKIHIYLIRLRQIIVMINWNKSKVYKVITAPCLCHSYTILVSGFSWTRRGRHCSSYVWFPCISYNISHKGPF